MKKENKYLIIGLPIFILILVIFSIVLLNKNPESNNEFLQTYDLEDLSVKEMVSTLDARRNEPDGFYAAITSSKFIYGDMNNKFEVDTPNDEFYLSFAPYINRTHPCGNHNLVTCTAELQNVLIHVTIRDDSGNTIIDGDYTSMDNGFIGIWLPKNIEGTITVTYNGLSASSEISTYSNSGTCLTTLQLS